MNTATRFTSTFACAACLALFLLATMRYMSPQAHVFGVPLSPAKSVRPNPPVADATKTIREALLDYGENSPWEIVPFTTKVSYDSSGHSFYATQVWADGVTYRVLLVNRPGAPSWHVKELEELTCDAAASH